MSSFHVITLLFYFSCSIEYRTILLPKITTNSFIDDQLCTFISSTVKYIWTIPFHYPMHLPPDACGYFLCHNEGYLRHGRLKFVFIKEVYRLMWFHSWLAATLLHFAISTAPHPHVYMQHKIPMIPHFADSAFLFHLFFCRSNNAMFLASTVHIWRWTPRKVSKLSGTKYSFPRGRISNLKKKKYNKYSKT